MQQAIARHAQAILRMALPSLRIVGLVYTGLGGMLAMLIVIGVAAMPATPALQQVAEPARQAVASLVQPSSEMVAALVSGPSVRVSVEPAKPKTALFVATTSLDITIDPLPDAEVSSSEESAPVSTVVVASTYAPRPQVVVEEQPVEDIPAEEAISEPAAEPEADVVEPAQTVTLQIARVEGPSALPTPIAPPTTPQEVKARVDAANQAAIDAAKAEQARAKAEADAANQAAIDANKRAAVADGAAMADAALALPTPAPVSTKAANKAASDAAKLAAAKAKADADAANQAAIDAARAAKSPKR
jgi:trimeric autotransporter adhesin